MKSLFLFFLGLLTAFLSAISMNEASAAEAASTNMIAEFQHPFKIATPKARRDLVIAAIDSGLIKRGLSLADAKVMFGQDFQVFRRKSQKDKLNVVVFFEPVKSAPNPMMSALRQGWYIDLVFTSDDTLEHYALSNLHK
jgi:hypothetical protein